MITAADDVARLIRARVPLWDEEQPEPGLWRFTDVDPDYRGRFVVVDGRERELRCTVIPGRFGPTVAGTAKGISVHVDLPHLVDMTDLRKAVEVLEVIGAIPTADGMNR